MTRTGHEPRTELDANQGSTRKRHAGPRLGVRKLPDRIGRPNPFGVMWAERVWDPVKGVEVRKERSKFFSTAAARDKRYNSIKKAKRAGNLRTMSRAEIDQWAGFKSAIGNTPWPEVVAGWKAHLRATGLEECTVTVEQHYNECLANAEVLLKAEKISADTYRQKKQKWRLFVEQFGDLTIPMLSTEDIRDWLDDFEFESMDTRDNYLKHVSYPLSLVVGKYITKNPCDDIDKLSTGGEIDRKLTVPQAAALLHTMLTHMDPDGTRPFRRLLARLPLEFFAGIRFSSAQRLVKGEVNQVDRGILHPKKKIKTRKRQYVEGFPENLWEWLKLAEDDAWDITPRQYLELKSRLFHAARVPHPHNCARHSFCTYHVAARQNPGVTAYLLCHANQQKLWDTYKGNATSAEGKAYELLTPATVEAASLAWRQILPRAEADPQQPGAASP